MWKRLQSLLPTRNLAVAIPLYFVGLFVLVAFLAPRIADKNNSNGSQLPAVDGVDAANTTNATYHPFPSDVVEPPRKDLFGSGDPAATNDEDQVAQPLQEDCLFTGNACVAFGGDCCPGLICVPVNETTSTCSHFKGSICINLNMICNDRVTGVECCDNAVCTPAGTQSRCLQPGATSPLLGSSVATPTPSSPRSSLRPTAVP
jgi:hypothetical protein